MDKNGNMNVTERTEQFNDMLSVADYSMDKLENGDYAVYDNQLGQYLDADEGEFKTAKDVADRLAGTIEENILENVQEGIEETFEKLGKEVPDELPITAEDIIEYLNSNLDVKQAMLEENAGWEYDIGYVDLLANHLDEVNFERLFDEKYFDKVFVDPNDEDAVLIEDDIASVHLSITDDVVSDILRLTDFDLKEQSEDVRSLLYDVDMEDAGIDYTDLYVTFDLNNKEEPSFEFIIQMSDDDKKTYTSYEDKSGGDNGKFIASAELKNAAKNALSEYEGKEFDKVITEYKEQSDKELE